MAFDIFRVDWILVDSIIIILLIIILCSIKIFKYKHRWRKLITNNYISKKNLDFSNFQLRNNKLFIKKWTLNYNQSLQEIQPDLPIIFIFSSLSLHFLPYAILEGLCSYGFTVNHIVIKKHRKFLKKKFILDHKKQENFYSILDYLKNSYPKINNQYYIISFDSYFSNIEFQNGNFKQIGAIHINPSFDNFQPNWISSDTKIKFNLIFSKKSYFWFRNRKIAKFMTLISQLNSKNAKITVLEHANVYFKNNETILLARLISIIRD